MELGWGDQGLCIPGWPVDLSTFTVLQASLARQPKDCLAGLPGGESGVTLDLPFRLKPLPAMRETWVQSLGQEDSPGEGNGNPLQFSCLENPLDREAWQATWGRKSRTRLSD